MTDILGALQLSLALTLIFLKYFVYASFAEESLAVLGLHIVLLYIFTQPKKCLHKYIVQYYQCNHIYIYIYISGRNLHMAGLYLYNTY